MVLQSFSVVATEECWEELAIMIYATRKFHPQPIYVLCDTPTKIAIERLGFHNIHFDVDANSGALEEAEKKYPNAKIGSDYHRVDCIAKKMDALERATFLYGNTLFLDADIVPVAPLQLDITHPVMVSPHYHARDSKKNAREYGVYNAGYIFNAEPDLPDLWREIYAERSEFFEQEGMIYFHEQFDVGRFPPSHNVGFWRFPVKRGHINMDCLSSLEVNVKSFHAHLTEKLFPRANKGLKRMYVEMRNFVLGHLLQAHPDLYNFIHSLK
jgi:hypothetical protein